MEWIELMPQVITAGGAVGGALAGALIVRTGGKAATRRVWTIETMREQRDYYSEVLLAATRQVETFGEIVQGFKRRAHEVFEAAKEAIPEGTQEFRVSAKHTLPQDLASKLRAANEAWQGVFARRIMHSSPSVELVIRSIDRHRNKLSEMLKIGRPDKAGDVLDTIKLRVEFLEQVLTVEAMDNLNAVHRELRSKRAASSSDAMTEGESNVGRRKLKPGFEIIENEDK